MTARASVIAFVSVVSLAASVESRADQQQVLDKMVQLNKSGIAAFQAGDVEQAKTDLLEAVVLGKQNGLALHAVMARTYVHLGVVQVDGAKDNEKGARYFVMAFKIRPDIEVTPALSSKAVAQVFDEAKVANGGAKAERPAPIEETPVVEEPKQTAKERRAEEAAAAKERKAEEAAAAVAAKERKAEEAATAKERKAEEAAAKERDRRAQADQAEKDKLLKELARDLQQVRDSQKKERAEIEKLQKEKQDKDKQLADLKVQFEKEKQEKEKALAELKGQLSKEKQEKDKLVNETKEKERKEREAKEKLEKEKLAAEAKERDRKSKENQERAEREKIAAGPDLPSVIPQPVFCPTQDESPVGNEVFVHCAVQPKVNAKAAVLYYRTTGLAHYNSLVMERSKKGWWTAAIPASKVTGKTLQYYVEVRGDKDEVAARNGKAKGPNIMSLRPAVHSASR